MGETQTNNLIPITLAFHSVRRTPSLPGLSNGKQYLSPDIQLFIDFIWGHLPFLLIASAQIIAESGHQINESHIWWVHLGDCDLFIVLAS